MSDRLPSSVLVTALLRRVNDTGGMGVMLARGDAQGGGILVIDLRAPSGPRVLERGIGNDGSSALLTWTPPDTAESDEIALYWQRRRRNDPDLWVLELDSPFAERFAAETLLGN